MRWNWTQHQCFVVSLSLIVRWTLYTLICFTTKMHNQTQTTKFYHLFTSHPIHPSRSYRDNTSAALASFLKQASWFTITCRHLSRYELIFNQVSISNQFNPVVVFLTRHSFALFRVSRQRNPFDCTIMDIFHSFSLRCVSASSLAAQSTKSVHIFEREQVNFLFFL